MENNPLYGQAWIEPHLFWISIFLIGIAVALNRYAAKLEREENDEDSK